MRVCDRVRTDGTVFYNGDNDGADEDDTVGNGADVGADDGADGAVKHLVHQDEVADCSLEEISKGGDSDGADGAVKHLVHRDEVADCCLEEISEGGASDGADGAVKHLVHRAQVADHCLEEIRKGGADDGADDSADGAEKHLVHLTHMPTPKSDHVLFDEKKALVKLSCVKQTKRVVGKRYFFCC